MAHRRHTFADLLPGANDDWRAIRRLQLCAHYSESYAGTPRSDRVVRVDNGVALAQAIPGTKFRVFEDAEHLVLSSVPKNSTKRSYPSWSKVHPRKQRRLPQGNEKSEAL